MDKTRGSDGQAYASKYHTQRAAWEKRLPGSEN